MSALTIDEVASPSSGTRIAVSTALAIAAFASIGAGSIHAAAIGVHSEHQQAVIAFTIVATLQIGWGVLAFLFKGRALPIAGVVVNTAILGAWILAKTSGIPFINGLQAAEDFQTTDGIAAGLAVVAVVGALVAVLRRAPMGQASTAVLSIVALAAALITVPAMVSAGSHSHEGGHATGMAMDHHGASAGKAAASGHHAASTAKPYDPTQPIDLGGTKGVTPEQQARAENLIALTLALLPQWSDPDVAEAAGFRSIGDAVTGDEHYINVAYFTDDKFLDPDAPESLVYKPDGKGGKRLAAAMYMMSTGDSLEDIPDVGGKLTQWHIHNNLCFTPENRVAGLTDASGNCRAGLHKGNEAPMLHVWIEPHPCGPFAALEGVGAGQIKAGETRLCDTAHA